MDAPQPIYPPFRNLAVNSVCYGRLTTESGVPVSSSNRSSQSTLYWTPFYGNVISIYSGTSWVQKTFTETSIALSSLTSGKNYDVFGYLNSGTFALELSSAWTNDTTRATALTTQDGILVKSGDATRRYLGTFRTTSTTTTDDTASKRLVYNYYNQEQRRFFVEDLTNHTYNTATVRQWRASTANQVEYCVGTPYAYGLMLSLEASLQAGTTSTFAQATVCLGKNSTTAIDGSFSAPAGQLLEGGLSLSFDAGSSYGYVSINQRGTGGGTNTFYFAKIHGFILN